MSAQELPNDVDELRRLVLEVSAKFNEQQSQLIARDTQIAQRDERIAKLEYQVHVLSKWTFGRRSEKRAQPEPNDTNQTWLPFADLLEAAQRVADKHDAQGKIEVHAPTGEEAQPARTRPAKRRSEFPAHLPRVRTVFELPEDMRVCCAKPMEAMGVELSRELERFEIAVVHEIARTKYCCRTCQMSVLTAPGPTRPLPKSLLGSNWLTQLLVERFGSHMPYYRLEQKYASEGLALSRTVLCRSSIALAERFEPVYAALGDEVTRDEVCFADETSVKVQDSKAGGPKKVWVWLYANKDGDCFYDYNESRGRDSPTRRLAHFKGALHDDGYCVYESALDPTRVAHVACWAHYLERFVIWSGHAEESEHAGGGAIVAPDNEATGKRGRRSHREWVAIACRLSRLDRLASRTTAEPLASSARWC